MDIGANKLIHTIPDIDEPHSMLFLPLPNNLGRRRGDGTLKIFDTGTYALIETVKLTEGADSSAYDRRNTFCTLRLALGRKLAYT